jgi:GNAT superfamily N-acetyltransferase
MTSTSVEIRRLSDGSFSDAVDTWNHGFQGYFVDMTITLDAFLARLSSEGVSPENSFLAFCDGKPAGLLLNGIRTVAGSKVAWNGGTGVRPEFRRRGIARALMQATLNLYQELNVEVATLEAIAENESAISLYRQFGYEVTERLMFLRHEDALEGSFCSADEKWTYQIKQVAPYAVSTLSFYQKESPWQTQWQSVNLKRGEAIIVTDRSGLDVGYGLYTRSFDEHGTLKSIALNQCVTQPDRVDARSIVRIALDAVYAPLDFACRRSTHNFRESNRIVTDALIEKGFSSFIEQVHMVLHLQTRQPT